MSLWHHTNNLFQDALIDLEPQHLESQLIQTCHISSHLAYVGHFEYFLIMNPNGVVDGKIMLHVSPPVAQTVVQGLQRCAQSGRCGSHEDRNQQKQAQRASQQQGRGQVNHAAAGLHSSLRGLARAHMGFQAPGFLCALQHFMYFEFSIFGHPVFQDHKVAERERSGVSASSQGVLTTAIICSQNWLDEVL